MQRRLGEWLAANRPAAEAFTEAVRDLVATGISALAPSDVLEQAAAAVRAVVATLAPHVPETPPARYPELGEATGPGDIMPFDPMIGSLSPVAPPLRFAFEDGRTTATVRFTAPYEGPPGCVHGGIIAACFDQVLNVANLAAGVAGPTASLEVRYLKPTPLGADVRFEADTPQVDGSRVRTSGRLCEGETVCALATGTFVTMSFDRVMALTSGRR
jgi:acyl-coenzyme A thioesterase PaaI-like protein